MRNFEFDPAFEHRLQQVLRAYSSEGVRNFDATETTQLAIRRVPRETPEESTSPSWMRALLVAVVLLAALILIVLVTGLIKLP